MAVLTFHLIDHRNMENMSEILFGAFQIAKFVNSGLNQSYVMLSEWQLNFLKANV